ncbi:tRNA 2-thiouridine(34) synthase MnmA [candidate division WOR-3 bacterium]|nr:tRNA 2-thiouridine(34) synthase MnmA [candidate division WOR-3 bacterium]
METTDGGRRARVLVAMSGGVDSSVAAALLKEQGYDVVGVTMRLFDDERNGEGGRGCCGFQGFRDAARVAAKLGFPHYTWDFRNEFEASVIGDFCSEYGRGRTPNPCLRCNEVLKFTELLGRAPQLGAGLIATGHYARIAPKTINDERGTMNEESWQLLKGMDARKDQSYFLYAMTQEQLSRVLMPVGDYTKAQVREMARELNLPVAEAPESQDICFVPDNDYEAFLRRRRPDLFRAGPVLDTSGNVLGQHHGIAGLTVGQRKGLGLAFGERRYVVCIEPEKDAVVLGTEDDARARVVEATDARWVSGSAPVEPFRAEARVRYQSRGGDALVEPLDGGHVRVTFDEPQWAPTPGQAVVFWQSDFVIGGATIGPE